MRLDDVAGCQFLQEVFENLKMVMNLFILELLLVVQNTGIAVCQLSRLQKSFALTLGGLRAGGTSELYRT